MMDAQQVETMIKEASPFVRKTGIRVLEYGPGRIVAELPDDASNRNHVGTYHAGAIFTFAETVGGLLVVSRFDLSKNVIVVRGGEAKYRRPVREALRVTAELSDDAAQAAMAALEEAGKCDLKISLTLLNEKDEEAARLTFDYHIRKQQ